MSARAGWILGGVLAGLALLGAGPAWAAPAGKSAPPASTHVAVACRPVPFGGRGVYLRGSFNSWTANEAQRLTWACNRFELVTRLSGAQSFKIGDEGWSADVDFGALSTGAGEFPQRMVPHGKNIDYNFTGTHRITLDMSDPSSEPRLDIGQCPEPPAPGPTLFLRGTMNNWTTQDDYAFQFSCDAYYLNVDLQGTHQFKVADAGWSDATSFGALAGAARVPAQGSLPLGRRGPAGEVGNIEFAFNGAHTLRLIIVGNEPVLGIGPKSYADPWAPSVSDPVALSLRHDSRNGLDKAPFGAVKAGTRVDFALASSAGVDAVDLVLEQRRMEGNQDVLEYKPLARVSLQKSVGSDGGLRWTGSHIFEAVGIHGYSFEARIGGKTWLYGNNRDAVHWTREKGSNGLGQVEEKPESGAAVRRYRLTVYSPDFSVPAWASDAVYYYIFPERFRNGNPGNDPQPGVDKYHEHTVEKHRDWNETPFKPGSGDGSDALYNNDFFGGDLAGIIEKLDYIAALGANTIYMTPVFTAASNHKYDTADYRNIDPRFGSNEDFETLTREAARRGIRVIPDASLNHTGSDSIYFDRFGNFGEQGAFAGGRIRSDSPYADWYSFDPGQSEPDRQYKGWVGVADLPELNKDSPSFRLFAYGAPDSVMKQWLDRGAAGWRMDVAPWVPDDFWREWRAAIKQHAPNALLISEAWFDSSKYFLGDMFDSTMNYIFRNTVLEYAAGGSAKAGYHNIELMREAYPPQAFSALMNLLSTHDAARALHVFGHGAGQADAAVIAQARQRLRLAMFFQMSFPGAPSIYYGDEVGVTGGDDPFNRATYPWADRGGQPDLVLLEDVKALLKMRRDHRVLRHGSLEAPLLLDDNLIVLLRRDGDAWALTASNNAPAARAVTVTLPDQLRGKVLREALTGARTRVGADGVLSLTVPALFGTALIAE